MENTKIIHQEDKEYIDIKRNDNLTMSFLFNCNLYSIDCIIVIVVGGNIMGRMKYLDGLKGWCAISVCIFHFILMFLIDGYVGWMAKPEAISNPLSYYFSNFPYSILTNNSFPLYIFFAIISFIICYSFLKNNDEDKIKRQAITRYFRFLPIVFISCFIAYLLLTFNLCNFRGFYEITGNSWVLAREGTYTFFEFLKISLFTSFFSGTQLLSPLWCLHYLFLGSFLAYFTMLMFNKVNNKKILFSLMILFFFFVDPNYLAFVFGMIAAVIVHQEYSLKKIHGIILVVLGCIFGLFPPVLLPKLVDISVFYAIGALLVIVGTHISFKDNYLLNNKFINFMGKESLGVIIVQFLIQQSLNIFLYITFFNLGMSNWLNILINFIINIGLTLVFTYVYSKTITPLTNYICKKVSNVLVNKSES